MKKLLFFFIIFTVSNSVKGQIKFCEPGAQWRYFFYDYLEGVDKPANMTYVGDTIVGGDTIKIIDFYSFFKLATSGSGSTGIKQRGDTIFMHNRYTSQTWQILYNFACPPNHHWTTTVKDTNSYSYNAPVTFTTNVNSVSTVTINNMALKKMEVSTCYFSQNGSLKCDTNTIYERIGCLSYLFYFANYPLALDYYVYKSALCYHDNDFGELALSPNGCGTYAGIRNYSAGQNNVSVYPNPFCDQLTIEPEQAEHFSAALYDLTGREIKQLQRNQTTLDTKDLQNGLYVLKLRNTENGQQFQLKIVKQN